MQIFLLQECLSSSLVIVLKVLMIVAPKNFRDEELFDTKKELENAGFEVVISSEGVKESTGMLGGKTKIDFELKEINSREYVAVVFVGGSGAKYYFNNKTALALAKKFFEENKIVSAICIAPLILANAGLLEGKEATIWPGSKEELASKGVVYVDEPVVVSGNIITANGPSAARKFGKTIAEELKKKIKK